MNVREYLEDNILLFDGAMGTYFSSIYEDPLYRCEYANITSPHIIKEIHTQYLEAGANAIKTNTFSIYSNQEDGNEFSYLEIIKKGYQNACESAKQFDAFVFCDIGPIQESHTMNVLQEYKKIIDTFLELGGTNFLFETFLKCDYLDELARYIKEKVEDAYIIISFAVQADGFTKVGNYGRDLIVQMEQSEYVIDAIGFNCVCGPHHMNQLLRENLNPQMPMIVMPNASYPTIIGNRVSYENNPKYFAKQMLNNVEDGAKIIGGCCGTTPVFIREIKRGLDKFHTRSSKTHQIPSISEEMNEQEEIIDENAFYKKLTTQDLVVKSLPIAVELDSPKVANVDDFMQGALALKEAGVDIITIADCPVARARMDSSLLACKVKRELGMDVMPHMTCRDRNINASKALLLGLSMEEINNVLIVTGDPIPSEQRSEVKSVYEFNSRMLIRHISALNQTLFESPFYLYAALNINARNFSVQLRLAKEKEKNGAIAFLTQPVLSDVALENLKQAKEALDAPILGGILPIVSERNANFINNEVPGIIVSDEIIHCYKDKTREECTELAVKISSRIASDMKPYIDGYYMITPFKRVDIITAIIEEIHKEELVD